MPGVPGLDFGNWDHGCTILHAPVSGEHLQAVLLDDGEELDGHAAGLFYAALPLLHRGLAGVEVAGKDRLADALALANPLDLLRPKALRDGEAGRVEVPHRRLVERAHLEHRRGRGVDRLKGPALELTLGRHDILPDGKSQTNPSPEAVDRPVGPRASCKPSQAA